MSLCLGILLYEFIMMKNNGGAPLCRFLSVFLHTSTLLDGFWLTFLHISTLKLFISLSVKPVQGFHFHRNWCFHLCLTDCHAFTECFHSLKNLTKSLENTASCGNHVILAVQRTARTHATASDNHTRVDNICQHLTICGTGSFSKYLHKQL